MQKLSNLKVLDIKGTNIDSGLEYLPAGLSEIYAPASGVLAENSKVNKLFTLLEPYRKKANMITDITIFPNEEQTKTP